MQVSIYAFRTLLWGAQQDSDDLNAVPEEVLPALEREATHEEMASHGWIHEAALDKMLGSGPNFTLSANGKQRARRWWDEYPMHSAAYEILQAIPATNGDLSGAEDAFEATYRDPVTNELPSADLIDQAGGMLYKNGFVSGFSSLGYESPHRLTLTTRGREVRREHYVPTLLPQMPDSTPEAATAAPSATYNYTTNITGGTIGAAQFGHQNHATVENVQPEVQQHFQTLRDFASEAPSEDRQELLEQIHQLEEAAQRGPSAFEELRNKFFSSFITKLGDRAVNILMEIPQLL
ncbi:hypothetical protein [Enteractinococcus helveticum]|jgi:hypothetical protein|uniref:Uncharacterized protein n=1 Tax=Enteractinococcus helveticum TaxID=1837282 RepID=A0A1B7LVJ0_9MICC|nr:hypothetical protein [Enteractinococcus helveticum]OAV53722.1 hypothetical protein A6F49_00690 [Enteractinococcus helveticum]